jgi:hypothetical protein
MTNEQLRALMAWVEAEIAASRVIDSSGPQRSFALASAVRAKAALLETFAKPEEKP